MKAFKAMGLALVVEMVVLSGKLGLSGRAWRFRMLGQLERAM